MGLELLVKVSRPAGVPLVSGVGPDVILLLQKTPGKNSVSQYFCRKRTIISKFNTRTLNPSSRLSELVKSAKEKNKDIIAIQEHRFFLPDKNIGYKKRRLPFRHSIVLEEFCELCRLPVFPAAIKNVLCIEKKSVLCIDQKAFTNVKP